MIIIFAFVCGSFAMAQTSNVSKKANLLPNGAVITDIKTGEVIRTTSGTVDFVNPTGPVQVSFNGVTPTDGPNTTSKNVGNGNTNLVLPATGSLIGTSNTVQPNNIPVKSPVNNATKLNPN